MASRSRCGAGDQFPHANSRVSRPSSAEVASISSKDSPPRLSVIMPIFIAVSPHAPSERHGLEATGLRRGERRLAQDHRLAAILGPDGGTCSRLDAGDEVVELGGVRFRIALDEEVQRLVARYRLAVRYLDRGGHPVAGPEHSAGAVHLDALVIAIARPHAVVDVALAAGGGAQHEHRRVVV